VQVCIKQPHQEMTTSGNKRQKRNVVYCQLREQSIPVKQILLTAERAEVVAGRNLPLRKAKAISCLFKYEERNHEEC